MPAITDTAAAAQWLKLADSDREFGAEHAIYQLRSSSKTLEGRLSFIAGEDNSKLAVLDLTSLKVLATPSVGKDPDVLAFDPELKRLRVSAESGNVPVF